MACNKCSKRLRKIAITFIRGILNPREPRSRETRLAEKQSK